MYSVWLHQLQLLYLVHSASYQILHNLWLNFCLFDSLLYRHSRMKLNKGNPCGVRCIGNWLSQLLRYERCVLGWQVSICLCEFRIISTLYEVNMNCRKKKASQLLIVWTWYIESSIVQRMLCWIGGDSLNLENINVSSHGTDWSCSILLNIQIGVDQKDLNKVFVQLTLEFLAKQVNCLLWFICFFI